MANQEIHNATLGTFFASGKHLSGAGTPFVQALELVTASEGGNKIDLAKAANGLFDVAHFGLNVWTVRKNTIAALADADSKYQPLISDGSGRLWCNVDVLPAAAAETDTISSADITGFVTEDGGANFVPLTVKRFRVTVSPSSSDQSVIAAVPTKKLKILSIVITCGDTGTTLTLESDEASDVVKHIVDMGNNGGQVLNYNKHGHFETAVGSALIATTSAGSDVQISGTYVEAS